MALVGSQLAAVWTDRSMGSGQIPFDKLYQAAISGAQLGVCRHIANAIEEIAQSLGFQTASSSINWNYQNKNGKYLGSLAGLHEISIYRDRNDGSYFGQSYGDVIALGKTDGQTAWS